jgi:surface antigen
MDTLLRFGTLLVCLGFTAPAHAQTYDDLTAPATSSNCRAIVGEAEIDGSMQQIAGRACLQSDGTWQIVQSSDGSVLWYPLAAYPYPDLWWWGPPILFGAGVSFIFVDHFHHFHHFYHFHPMNHGRFGAPIGTGFHRGPFPGRSRDGFGGVHGFGGTSGAGGMHRH